MDFSLNSEKKEREHLNCADGEIHIDIFTDRNTKTHTHTSMSIPTLKCLHLPHSSITRNKKKIKMKIKHVTIRFEVVKEKEKNNNNMNTRLNWLQNLTQCLYFILFFLIEKWNMRLLFSFWIGIEIALFKIIFSKQSLCCHFGSFCNPESSIPKRKTNSNTKKKKREQQQQRDDWRNEKKNNKKTSRLDQRGCPMFTYYKHTEWVMITPFCIANKSRHFITQTHQTTRLRRLLHDFQFLFVGMEKKKIKMYKMLFSNSKLLCKSEHFANECW